VAEDVDMTSDPAVEAVKEYCLTHREVDFQTTAITFSELAFSELSRSPPPSHPRLCMCMTNPFHRTYIFSRFSKTSEPPRLMGIFISAYESSTGMLSVSRCSRGHWCGIACLIFQ